MGTVLGWAVFRSNGNLQAVGGPLLDNTEVSLRICLYEGTSGPNLRFCAQFLSAHPNERIDTCFNIRLEELGVFRLLSPNEPENPGKSSQELPYAKIAKVASFQRLRIVYHGIQIIGYRQAFAKASVSQKCALRALWSMCKAGLLTFYTRSNKNFQELVDTITRCSTPLQPNVSKQTEHKLSAGESQNRAKKADEGAVENNTEVKGPTKQAREETVVAAPHAN